MYFLFVHACTHVRVCACAFECVRMRVCLHVCASVFVCVCEFVYEHVCASMCARMCVSVCARVYVRSSMDHLGLVSSGSDSSIDSTSILDQ